MRVRKKLVPALSFVVVILRGLEGLGYEFKNNRAQLQDGAGNQKVACKRTTILKYYCAG